MANITKKEKLSFFELKSVNVDITNGDVLLFDNVKDISPIYPLNPLTVLIVQCMKGQQKVLSDEQEYVLEASQLLFCAPSVSMKLLDHSDDFECKVICISAHLIRILTRDKSDVFDESAFTNQLTIKELQDYEMEELNTYFTVVRSKLKNNSSTQPYVILLTLLRAMMLDLCHKLAEIPEEQIEHKLSEDKILFNRFLTMISSSDVKRLPVSTYASQLAVTPKRLTMLCLKYSNMTASDWVTQYALEEIRFFLKSTELSIKEISVQLGFSTMSHFGSYVRKHLGMSPSEYRHSKKA